MKEQVVIIRHTLKNALIPVVTRSAGLIGRAAAAQPLYDLQLPILVGSAVIMENIFNLPEIGRLLVNALNDRDYPMVSGVNLFFAIWGGAAQSPHRPDLSLPGPEGAV